VIAQILVGAIGKAPGPAGARSKVQGALKPVDARELIQQHRPKVQAARANPSARGDAQMRAQFNVTAADRDLICGVAKR
jgi:hypothetical protein